MTDNQKYVELQEEIKSRISESIEKTGISIIHVDGDATGPSFGYTVGMTAFGLPEVLVVGNVGIEMVTDMLNTATGQMREFKAPQIGLIDLGLTTGNDALRCLVRLVTDINHARDYYVTKAVQYYPTTEVHVVQLLWADNRNQLPIEPTYSADQLYQQPVI